MERAAVMTRQRIALLSMGAVLLLIAGSVERFHYQGQQAGSALKAAGYGETRFQRSGHYCPFGEAAFSFIAQGGTKSRQDGRENEGYVCVGYFGGAAVHEVKFDPAHGIDWD